METAAFCLLINAAQHGHWTGGIHRHFQAFLRRRIFLLPGLVYARSPASNANCELTGDL